MGRCRICGCEFNENNTACGERICQKYECWSAAWNRAVRKWRRAVSSTAKPVQSVEDTKPEAPAAEKSDKRRKYTPNMIIAARILCDSGFSQNAAAEVLGVTSITVSRWRKHGDELMNSNFYTRKSNREAMKHESAGCG